MNHNNEDNMNVVLLKHMSVLSMLEIIIEKIIDFDSIDCVNA